MPDSNHKFRNWKSKAKLAAAATPPLRARLPDFFGLTLDPDAALSNFCVAFIGVGSVGRGAADRIARLKPGGMYFVDRGRFKPESVETHPIDPREANRRQSKARSAAEYCGRISPSTDIRWFDGPVQALDCTEFLAADIILLASDNTPAEVYTGQLGASLSKKVVHGAVHGESLTAQVRCYTNSGPESCCLRCSFSQEEEESLDQNTIFSCAGGVPEFGVKAAPTMSTASLCAIAADIAAMQILRFALKLGEPLADQQIEYAGFTNKMTVTPLPPRSAKCRCDHTHWDLRHFPTPVGKATLAELADASGLLAGSGHEGISFAIPGRQYVDMATCAHCGSCRVQSFTTPAGELPPCPRCKGPLAAQPFFSEDAVAASHLKELTGRPLRALGAGDATAVLVRRNDSAVLIHNQPARNK